MGDIIVLPDDGSGGGGSTEQRLFIEANLLALQATTPDEGFLGYAQDSDLYYYYDGAAWNLIETKIDHDNLVNYVANEHVDHSAVTLTAGTGLSGGGDITASRTFDLANTAVVAGSYGAAGTVGTFTVDAQGRLTAATDALIDIGVSQVNDLSDELASLTDAEVQQLQNIDTSTISITQWGYLGTMNQGVATTDNVTFADVTGDLATFADVTGDLATFGGIGVASTHSFGVGTAVGDRVVTSFNNASSGIASIQIENSVGAAEYIRVKNNSGRMYFEIDDTSEFFSYRVGGAEVARITDAGEGYFGDGTFAAPGIAFLSDTDTGIYNRGANDIGIATGGSTGIAVDATRLTTFFPDEVTDILPANPGEVKIGNAATSAAEPSLSMYAEGASGWNRIVPVMAVADDTGTNPVMEFSARRDTSTAFGTRETMFRFSNNATTLLDITKDGELLTPNGSSANAAYGFQSAVNTGMYRSSGGNLVHARAGTDVTICTSTAFVPAADNTFNLGNGSFRWTEVFAVNGTINTSDEREKNTIQDSDLGLNFINSLRPVSYKWNEGTSDRTHYGLIAQELETAITAAGKTTQEMAAFVRAPLEDEDGSPVLDEAGNPKAVLGVRYDQLHAPLIKAIQELTARVEVLESQ